MLSTPIAIGVRNISYLMKEFVLIKLLKVASKPIVSKKPHLFLKIESKNTLLQSDSVINFEN